MSETITQADIEAAAGAYDSLAYQTIPGNFGSRVRAGETSELVRAFARHRIKAKMRGALAMRDAADILEDYAEYIRSVKACELERHPYLPQVEYVISELRAIIGESHE